jgi:hypothetical protein
VNPRHHLPAVSSRAADEQPEGQRELGQRSIVARQHDAGSEPHDTARR